MKQMGSIFVFAVLLCLVACGPQYVSESPNVVVFEPPITMPMTELPAGYFEVTGEHISATKSSSGDLSSCTFLEITNTGDVPLLMGTGMCDLYDTNSNLLKSSQNLEGFPNVILPGEKGYYYQVTNYPDLRNPEKIRTTVTPNLSVTDRVPATFELSNVNIDTSGATHVVITGHLSGITQVSQEPIYLFAVIYDTQNNPIGIARNLIAPPFNPGDEFDFTLKSVFFSADATPHNAFRTEITACPRLSA